MAEENAVLNENELENELSDSFDFDELEKKLQEQLEEGLEGLEFLKEEKGMISNPEHLGRAIQDVIWDQFINQIAATAGEEFIVENRGLNLDWRDEAHIQTEENFTKGKIATHNYISREQLEQNYHRYRNRKELYSKFRHDYVNPGMDETLPRAGKLYKRGIYTVPDKYTGEQIPTQTRLENGKNNPKAAQRDHVKSVSELYKDHPVLQMGTTNEELAGIINHPKNMGYTTAERNNRKSDLTADEMDEKDKTKHWQMANKESEEYVESEENKIRERLEREGRKTQKEEKFRIAKSAVKAAVMQLLAELVKEIIAKLVKWLKSAKRTVEALLDSLKEAIRSFVGKLETHVINAGHTVGATIAAAIGDKVFNTVKRACTILKQSWKSLKEAIDYLKSPENKGKPMGRLILETGKIVIAGLTGVGALFLSEAIEDSLMTIPILAVEIPLLGSLANIFGIFFGAVVAGIIGAIAINLIDKLIAKKQKGEIQEEMIKKGNIILGIQAKQRIVAETKLEDAKENAQSDISKRHHDAAEIMEESFANIMEDFVDDFSDNDIIIDEEDIKTNKAIDEMSDDLDRLLDSL